MLLQILTYRDYLLYKEIIEEGSELVCNEDEQLYYLDDEVNEKIQINNKHDKCFRDILSDKREISNFLKDFINPESTIKSEDMEPYNTSFVTSKYQNREADIVYKIKGKNAFILIEHQSKIDKQMPYRLLEYYTEILRINKTRNEEEMPIVVPIVIYTGSEKWKANGYISEKQAKLEGYEEGRLDIKYNLVQANNFKTEELLSKGTMLANAMIIENSDDTEELMKNLEKIIENINNEEKLSKLRNIVKYILQGILKKEDIEKIEKIIEDKEEENYMDELIEKIKRNDQKKMNEIAQKSMERGINQGVKQGVKKGVEQGAKRMKQEIIKNMIKLGIDKEKIEQITQIKIEEIETTQTSN